MPISWEPLYLFVIYWAMRIHLCTKVHFIEKYGSDIIPIDYHEERQARVGNGIEFKIQF